VVYSFLKVPEIGQVLELYTIFDFFSRRIVASSNQAFERTVGPSAQGRRWAIAGEKL
jgi:hypothetical protein